MKHLLILVTYKLKSGMRDAFLKTMSESGILEEVLKEDGIVRYHYYLGESNPDIILLVEEWLTAEHQKKHLETPHMARFQPIKAEYILETIVEKAEI